MSFTSLFTYKRATLLGAVLLLVLQLYHVFYWPVWRDDGMFAEVAKSIAQGGGYSIALFDESVPFSQAISAGPLLILPAALMIKIVGNTIWAPALAAVLLNWACLYLVYCAAKRFPGGKLTWPFSFWFLVFALFLSITNEFNYGIEAGDKLAMWYLLLGQIQALCCVVAGGLLLLAPARQPKYLLIGALLLGIAFTTKSITAIASCVLLACAALPLMRHHKRLLLLFLLGVIIPPALFELFKWLSLGTQGYFHMLELNANYYKSDGFASLTSRGQSISYFDALMIHLIKISEFVFGLLFIVFFPVYISFIRHLIKRTPGFLENPLVKAGLAFLLCFIAHITWWTFCAGPGSDRHLVPAFFYWAASTSLLLAAYPRETEKDNKKLYLFFIVFFVTHLDAAIFLGTKSLATSPRMEEYSTVVHQLDTLQEQGVALYSCGFNTEFEYLMKNTANFINCNKLAKRDRSKKAALVNFYIAGDLVAIPRTRIEFLKVPPEILAQCPRLLSKTAFTSVHECD